MFTLQVMSESGEESPEVEQNTTTGAPQFSTVVQGAGDSQVGRNLAQVSSPVSNNVFTGKLQGTLGFTTAQVRVLVEDGYGTQ